MTQFLLLYFLFEKFAGFGAFFEKEHTEGIDIIIMKEFIFEGSYSSRNFEGGIFWVGDGFARVVVYIVDGWWNVFIAPVVVGGEGPFGKIRFS